MGNMQIILNYILVFILPVIIGISLRFAVRKIQKPHIVTGGLILLAAIMWLLAVVVPSHGNEANGVRAIMTTCLALGALCFALITRIKQKCIVNHVIALGILLIGFVLARYVFFDVHGMKEFPVVLLALGFVVMVISALRRKRFLPYFISAGYIIGFIIGFIFQTTEIDANGVSVNNLWVIWAVVYMAFIVVGWICDLSYRKYLHLQLPVAKF